MQHRPDSSVADFYDDLAPLYHLVYEDWDASLRRQGQALDRVLQNAGIAAPSILDCACGIGTQALGLSLLGYDVHGRDISDAAIDRAKKEAARLQVGATFTVGNMASLADDGQARYDVVLACDNALPHCLSGHELAAAVAGMVSSVNPGGLLMASIRDYDALLAERPNATTPSIMDGGRRIRFQVWDWEDDRTYALSLFLLLEEDGNWQTSVFKTRYRALLRSELSAALEGVGVERIRWQMPQETGFFQPLVTGCRGA